MKPEKVCSSNDRIKELLEHFQINQTQFCKKTGLQKSALSNYLNGNRLPRQDQLFKIADSFNVSAAWLMGYDVPMMYDTSTLLMYQGGGDQKPHIEYYGQAERIALYARLIQTADHCKPEQLEVILETLKSIAASNKKTEK